MSKDVPMFTSVSGHCNRSVSGIEQLSQIKQFHSEQGLGCGIFEDIE